MKVSLPGRAPDFVGFGVHRSGSTWLNAQLRQHPDIWTPPPDLKEVHYFDINHRRGPDWYAGNFPEASSLRDDSIRIWVSRSGPAGTSAFSAARRIARSGGQQRRQH